MDPDRKFVIVLRRLGTRSCLWRCRCNLRTAKSSRHGRDNPTGRDRNLDILWGCGNHLRWQVRNFDAFCFVVVAGRDDLRTQLASNGKSAQVPDLDNLVARK